MTSIVVQVQTRAAFDRLDEALRRITAFSDADVLAARIALGRNVGVLVASYEAGGAVAHSARTFPPHDDEGNLLLVCASSERPNSCGNPACLCSAFGARRT